MLLAERFGEGNAAFTKAACRLENGEPLAYILGRWWFCRETYTVTPDVLVPQPDTEILVEKAAQLLPRGITFADAGCGSGCIGISLLAMRPDLRCISLDISDGALALTEKNAAANGVGDRLTVRRSDILGGLAELSEPVGAILSNPPYIRRDVIPTLSPQVLAEPLLALDGGEDGLDFYRALLSCARKRITPGGLLIAEIGYDQKAALAALTEEYGLSPADFYRDYGGNDRVCVIPVR